MGKLFHSFGAVAKKAHSPNFSSSRWRECVRTAKIGPDLRLAKCHMSDNPLCL